MNKILKIKDAIKISKKLREQKKNIVLAGGCFDIIHAGHIKFLEKAKRKDEKLFVLLESDEKVNKLKGEGRPINSQKDRAYVLQAIESIDYIVLLPNMKKNGDYDKLISQLKPSTIATVKNDPMIIHKKRQAKMIGGKIRYVISRIKNKSTSRIINFLHKNL